MRTTKLLFSAFCFVIGGIILASGFVAHAQYGQVQGETLDTQSLRKPSGIPTKLPVPVVLPNLPENFNSATVTPERLKELEKKYANKDLSIKELQKKQQEELKAKREAVKSIWKICEEKILAYRKSRQEAARQLKASSQCQYVPVDQTVTKEERVALQKTENTRVTACRKELLTKMADYEKETKLQILALRKSCNTEAGKPVSSPSATKNVQGLEFDEVPIYDFTTQIVGY